MSGHSKWSTIKRKKEKADAQRGRVFTRLIREITAAARQGGGDPEANARLRTAIAGAKAANMPQDNIEKAIKRGTGELPGMEIQEIVYEGYGPGGVAIFIETMTDNRNRTTQELRHILSRYGGSLGAVGSVAWMFEPRGVILVETERYDEETILNAALEAGADDVREDGIYFEITTQPEAYERVKRTLVDRGIELASAESTKVPQSTVRVEGKKAEQLLRLVAAIEEQDDVQNLFANFDVPEEIMTGLSD
ncbi:transcriptional regulator [candidate division TA06 bacterium SM1_40]|jgi:YebC/PmpR family DNA-binding regulatory protein|uniref:Probable transcriptional regulatory protein AMJ71_06760 n=2 Tax=Bacteria division TA06 TaxID=1156500 RepID=A0A0S8JIH7_UNCT6|nr:MAG: transcriptional regulator [candidate division TA06 bacterium SM23_40]KPL09344.1 MAG: transcriptional regulator [candidate division TA06 bacterium SM1_40]